MDFTCRSVQQYRNREGDDALAVGTTRELIKGAAPFARVHDVRSHSAFQLS